MPDKCEAVAIIPARGGSKGLPRKNVLPLCGKPLLAWTVEAALQSQSVERVIVSTDCPEIGEVARRFGADVSWRPESLSTDHASSEAALLHTLESEFAPLSGLPTVTAFLQCTSPLTSSRDIDETVKALLDQKADTALAVADFHYFLWRSSDSDFVGINHDKRERLLRQERENQFVETGAVYAFRTKGFLEHKHRFFGKTAYYVMPEERVLEIDSAVDFEIAQIRMKTLLASQQNNALPSNIELIVFDFDGVFTDDKVILNEDGCESVSCSRADGMGVKLLRHAGYRAIILSTETNPVVSQRAAKLKLEVIQGVEDKLNVLTQYLSKHQIEWSNVVYVGNDVNDLECIRAAGCGVAPSNAIDEIRNDANLLLTRSGGDHAVRELADLILTSGEP